MTATILQCNKIFACKDKNQTKIFYKLVAVYNDDVY